MLVQTGFDEWFDGIDTIRIGPTDKCRWCKKTVHEVEDPGGLCAMSMPGHVAYNERLLRCHEFMIGSG